MRSLRDYIDLVETLESRSSLKEEQINEIAPLLAATARALVPLLGRIGPGLSSLGRGAASTAGKAAQVGAGTAAKTAVPVGAGLGIYDILSTIADSIGGVGQVYSDIKSATEAIIAVVGNGLDSSTIGQLAAAAVKYAIPIGILLALLYGGKKLFDYINEPTPAATK